MKKFIPFIAEVTALAAITYGVYEINRPIGIIVGGISAFVYVQAATR